MGVSDTTTTADTLEILLATCQRIDERLARLEETIQLYQPLLTEVSRRMAGPIKWRKGGT